MKVLAVASEIYPLVKTGGLADVAGALPAALAHEGIEVTTLVPGYPAVLNALGKSQKLHHFPALFGGTADVIAAEAKGLNLFVLDAPHLFNRPGSIYLGPNGLDWPDNSARYAALSQTAAMLARGEAGTAAFDAVHLHDWQAGLTAAYLDYGGGPPCVITIHNLAFQGHYPATIFPTLGLPAVANAISGVEYFGGVGYLKAGLALADAITTVSPTYAREIQTPEDGMALDGLLRVRNTVLHGILNGIDTMVWDPATDKAIAHDYDAQTLPKRAANKRAVEKRFELKAGEGPLFCIVSRLTSQKGMDLVLAAADMMVGLGVRLAVLGSGDAALEAGFRAAAARHPGSIGVVTAYDEALSHLMQAGSDAILIPSRFEPCGLTQLYGLRYGCVPIVSRVGGLADTVIDANEAALASNSATGFVFAPVTQTVFEQTLERAVALYTDHAAWSSLQTAGMKTDVSWNRSAARYAKLFRSLKGTT
jgi:starch synthase